MEKFTFSNILLPVITRVICFPKVVLSSLPVKLRVSLRLVKLRVSLRLLKVVSLSPYSTVSAKACLSLIAASGVSVTFPLSATFSDPLRVRSSEPEYSSASFPLYSLESLPE